MLTVTTAPDYLLCLRCGFAGWLGMWLEHCPDCGTLLPGSRTETPRQALGAMLRVRGEKRKCVVIPRAKISAKCA